MASPVLEAALFDRRRKVGNSDKAPPAVPILGVPCDAVSAFVRYLYETRSDVFSLVPPREARSPVNVCDCPS